MKKKKLNLRDIKPNPEKEHSQNDGHNHSGSESVGKFNTYLPAIFSFVMLMIGIAIDYFDMFPYFKGWIRILWYVVAYIPVGFPVIKEGWNSINSGDFFTEFFFNYM